MYVKLALRNVKRSIKDYIVYFFTLTLCVSLFYAFSSLSSLYYNQKLPSTLDLKSLLKYIKYAAVFITLILIFLIVYVNNYMISRKRREFAIHTIMGMERRTTAMLFFLETSVMGLFSIIAGSMLGALFSQVLTVIILNSVGETYKLYFSLYPDTFLLTLLFFLLIFAMIGFFNIRTIEKIKIIDMLNDDKKTEVEFRKSIFMDIMLILLSILSVKSVAVGIDILCKLSEQHNTIAARSFIKIFVTGAWIFVVIVIVYIAFMIIQHKKRNYTFFCYIVALLVIDSFIIVLSSVKGLDDIVSLKNIEITIDDKLLLILAALLFGTFSIYGLYYCLSSVIVLIKKKFIKIRYKNQNLFLLGQITAKLSTSSKIMTIITVTLLMSIITLAMGMVLSQWSLGYLREKAPFDIQIFSGYSHVKNIKSLSNIDYSFTVDYMKKQRYKFKEYKQCNTYFVHDKDFNIKDETRMPPLAISLSDYNDLRQMIDLKPINLKDGCFAIQWQSTSTNEEINKFIRKNNRLKLADINLKISSKGNYKAGLGEYIYNNPYKAAMFILPDEVCLKLTKAGTFFIGNTYKALTFNKALEVNDYLYHNLKKRNLEIGNYNGFRIRTLQKNESLLSALSINLLFIYGGIVLLIICFTILSLQQLSDSMEHRDRFKILKKLGVEQKSINKVILKQMAVWFGIPAVVATIFSGIILWIVMRSMMSLIAVFIGKTKFVIYIVATIAVVIIIAFVYFLITAMLFKRNIESK